MSKKVTQQLKQLLPFCNDYEREVIEYRIKCGRANTLERFGLSSSGLHRIKLGLERRALKKGYSPKAGIETPPMPDYFYKRVSTNYDGEGKIKQQWLIQEQDKANAWLAMQQTTDKLLNNLPTIPTIDFNPDIEYNDQLLNQYTITDYHFGMLAWHEEGGANWDVKIAKRTLVDTFKYLITNSPNAETGVFANIGDFMHYDGWLPVTPSSGHVLDTESRFPKIVDAAVDAIIECIGLLLQKHKKVVIINMQGNHDLASSYWLQKICSTVFKDNPRIEFREETRIQVDKLVIPFYGLQHGKTALFYHHGHKKNFKQQSRLYPAQFPLIWGNTVYRYGHTGHYHHTEVLEEYGITIEMHNTMAAKDAYSSHGGYFAERSANAISYHKEHGEVSRIYCKPAMLL